MVQVSEPSGKYLPEEQYCSVEKHCSEEKREETSFIILFTIFILTGCSALMFLIVYFLYIVYLSIYQQV